jgi:antitoxin HigA-1
MPMKNPPHPGQTIRHDCLEPLGLSVGEAARVLGVTVNGRSGISPELAVRLAKAFGSSPETWLGIQLDFDLAQVRRRESEIKVERVARPDAAPELG